MAANQPCKIVVDPSAETIAYQSSQSAPISAEGKALLVHDMSNTLRGDLESKEVSAQISKCIGRIVRMTIAVDLTVEIRSDRYTHSKSRGNSVTIEGIKAIMPPY